MPKIKQEPRPSFDLRGFDIRDFDLGDFDLGLFDQGASNGNGNGGNGTGSGGGSRGSYSVKSEPVHEIKRPAKAEVGCGSGSGGASAVKSEPKVEPAVKVEAKQLSPEAQRAQQVRRDACAQELKRAGLKPTAELYNFQLDAVLWTQVCPAFGLFVLLCSDVDLFA